MSKGFMLIPAIALNKPVTAEIIHCNELTARFGLTLSRSEAEELAETYARALSSNERIELKGDTLRKIILQFCDSPFLSQYNYAATLNELVETFYYFKNETLDEIGDDELIAWMKKYFNQTCQGSVELLQSRELESLAREIHSESGFYKDSDVDDDSFGIGENTNE